MNRGYKSDLDYDTDDKEKSNKNFWDFSRFTKRKGDKMDSDEERTEWYRLKKREQRQREREDNKKNEKQDRGEEFKFKPSSSINRERNEKDIEKEKFSDRDKIIDEQQAEIRDLKNNLDELKHHISSSNQDVRKNRFIAQNVRVEHKNIRSISPDGLSTKNSRKTLETICKFIQADDNTESNKNVKEFIKTELAENFSNIFKNQYKENRFNEPHTTRIDKSLMPDFIRLGETSFNTEKVSDKQRVIFRTINDIKSLGIFKYIKQFKLHDLSNFSETEFATILHINLPKDIREELNSIDCSPSDVDLSTYLDMLNELVSGGRISYSDIDKKFNQFESKANKIINVLADYQKILKEAPNEVMSQIEKDRKIISKLQNFLPSAVKTLLIEKEQNQGGCLTFPAFHTFIKTHSREIDNYLRNYQRNNRIKFIEEIIDRKNEETNRKSASYQSSYEPAHNNYQEYLDTRNSFHKGDTSQQYKNFDEQRPLPKQSSGLNHNLDDSSLSEGEKFEGVFKLDSKNPPIMKKCDICKQYYHNNLECIFNANNDTRKRNQLRIKLSCCLLCRRKNHIDSECPTFKDTKPVPDPCQDCESKGFYRFYHPVESYIRNNFLGGNRQEESNT